MNLARSEVGSNFEVVGTGGGEARVERFAAVEREPSLESEQAARVHARARNMGGSKASREVLLNAVEMRRERTIQRRGRLERGSHSSCRYRHRTHCPSKPLSCFLNGNGKRKKIGWCLSRAADQLPTKRLDLRGDRPEGGAVGKGYSNEEEIMRNDVRVGGTVYVYDMNSSESKCECRRGGTRRAHTGSSFGSEVDPCR